MCCFICKSKFSQAAWGPTFAQRSLEKCQFNCVSLKTDRLLQWTLMNKWCKKLFCQNICQPFRLITTNAWFSCFIAWDLKDSARRNKETGLVLRRWRRFAETRSCLNSSKWFLFWNVTSVPLLSLYPFTHCEGTLDLTCVNCKGLVSFDD